METVIFSRKQIEEVVLGDGDGARTYTLAPLSMFDQQEFRAEMAQAGATSPGLWRMRAAAREALEELAPSNKADLVAIMDEIEAIEDDRGTVPDGLSREREMIILACMQVPHFAALRAADERYWGMMPLVLLRRALRGWRGAGLPPFAQHRRRVPDELIEQLPPGDVARLGSRAYVLTFLPASAGNVSGAPSPSPEVPTATAAA
jgi:hypothetical protein